MTFSPPEGDHGIRKCAVQTSYRVILLHQRAHPFLPLFQLSFSLYPVNLPLLSFLLLPEIFLLMDLLVSCFPNPNIKSTRPETLPVCTPGTPCLDGKLVRNK